VGYFVVLLSIVEAQSAVKQSQYVPAGLLQYISLTAFPQKHRRRKNQKIALGGNTKTSQGEAKMHSECKTQYFGGFA